MPRAAARLFLEVENVRAERLQNITADDIRAEGTPDTPHVVIVNSRKTIIY